MRENIFQALYALVQNLGIFTGEDGTVRVYDYPETAPPGYPYAVLGSEGIASDVLDTARDVRKYNFVVQIVGEKFGEPAGKTQSQALKAMRATEDLFLAALDANNDLSRPDLVIRTMPTQGAYALSTDQTRVVLTISVSVDTTVPITM